MTTYEDIRKLLRKAPTKRIVKVCNYLDLDCLAVMRKEEMLKMINEELEYQYDKFFRTGVSIESFVLNSEIVDILSERENEKLRRSLP